MVVLNMQCFAHFMAEKYSYNFGGPVYGSSQIRLDLNLVKFIQNLDQVALLP